MSDEAIVFNWVQPTSNNEEVELVLNFNEVAAVMRWTEKGVEVETVYNKWLLKQIGKFRTTIEVRNSRTNKLESIYKAGFRRGGTIQHSKNEQTFSWKANSSKEFEVLDSKGATWANIRLDKQAGSRFGFLETFQTWIDKPEFEVLLVLGWYLGMTELGFGGITQSFPDGTPGNGGPFPTSNSF